MLLAALDGEVETHKNVYANSSEPIKTKILKELEDQNANAYRRAKAEASKKFTDMQERPCKEIKKLSKVIKLMEDQLKEARGELAQFDNKNTTIWETEMQQKHEV